MKKSTLKKAMSLLIVMVMAAAMLTGCGKKNNNDKPSSGTTDTPTATSAPVDGSDQKDDGGQQGGEDEGAYPDYSNGFPEKVTIEIPVYDRAFEGWNVTDNFYTQWVQREFGDKYNVEVKYVAIGRTTEVQDFMQLIAAGNAPDVIFHYDMPQAVNYYSEGAMQELDTEEIAYYAPYYYEKMKDAINTYGQIDGGNYFFFAEREAIYYNWVTLIRQDWLDAVGMDMPHNLDELNAVLAAWKDAGLGTLGHQLITKSFTYEYPFFDENISTSDYAKYLDLNVAPFTWEPTKKFLENINKQFNEGLIDPEFYLNKEDADFKADFVSGRCGTYSFYINSQTDTISSLLANNPDAKVAVLDPGALCETGNNYYYKYPPYGMIMGINSKSSAEERAAVWMLLDWMSQPENLFYLQNGVEGQNYTLDADGIAVPVADYAGESKLSQNNNKDYWCLVAEVATYGDEQKNYKANLKNLAPAGYEDLIQASYDYAKQYEQYGVITPIFTKALSSTGEYSADLNAMWQTFYVDCATCKPEEFEAKYAEYCQEYLDGGYQAILDEKQALLDEGSYIAE